MCDGHSARCGPYAPDVEAVARKRGRRQPVSARIVRKLGGCSRSARMVTGDDLLSRHGKWSRELLRDAGSCLWRARLHVRDAGARRAIDAQPGGSIRRRPGSGRQNQGLPSGLQRSGSIGQYDPLRLANFGIGHGGIDGGAGYTYFDKATGYEFSAVGGLTYNLENPYTKYQSGIDAHVDLGASKFVSEQLHIGLVGYYYQQITPDRAQPSIPSDFKSRVAAVGPQIGYFFPIGEVQGYVNLKGYGEFSAQNRLQGWTTWLTLVISPKMPKAPDLRGPVIRE